MNTAAHLPAANGKLFAVAPIIDGSNNSDKTTG
jgi:hypothetical protein